MATFNLAEAQQKSQNDLNRRVEIARRKQSHLPLSQIRLECAMEMVDELEEELKLSEIEPDGRED